MKNENQISRRKFVKAVVGSTALLSIANSLQIFAKETQQMPTRPLGKTGHDVCLFSLGGQATLEEDGKKDEAVAIINRAIDLGVNYIDTAAWYGMSETYIGEVMKTRRKEVFLATKTHERSYDDSMRLLEQSLKNLQTDHIDTWQLHNVRTQNDVDKIFSKDGAIKAMEKARDEKIVRFVGITGHRDPLILKKGIEQYPFDSILLALNAADKHEASFIDTVLPIAVKKKMAIIGMKVPARGRIFQKNGITSMEQAMGYVLTLPVSTVIVGISTLKELEENVQIAKNFQPFSQKKMKQLEALTKPYYAEASWFKKEW